MCVCVCVCELYIHILLVLGCEHSAVKSNLTQIGAAALGFFELAGIVTEDEPSGLGELLWPWVRHWLLN